LCYNDDEGSIQSETDSPESRSRESNVYITNPGMLSLNTSPTNGSRPIESKRNSMRLLKIMAVRKKAITDKNLKKLEATLKRKLFTRMSADEKAKDEEDLLRSATEAGKMIQTNKENLKIIVDQMNNISKEAQTVHKRISKVSRIANDLKRDINIVNCEIQNKVTNKESGFSYEYYISRLKKPSTSNTKQAKKSASQIKISSRQNLMLADLTKNFNFENQHIMFAPTSPNKSISDIFLNMKAIKPIPRDNLNKLKEQSERLMRSSTKNMFLSPKKESMKIFSVPTSPRISYIDHLVKKHTPKPSLTILSQYPYDIMTSYNSSRAISRSQSQSILGNCKRV